MGFNQKKGLSIAGVLILLVVTNIVAFLFPLQHGIIFWLGYSFAMLANLLMLAVLWLFSDSKNNYQSFMRLSLLKIAWIYLVLQMLLSYSQIFDITMPYLFALLSNCVLTGLFLLIILSSHAAVESIESQEEKVTQKILFLQNIQSMLKSVKTQDAELCKLIEMLIEDFQFSDPMSHSMLAELESQIETKVSLLKANVSDVKKAKDDIECIRSLLQDRNMKCKLLKNVKEEKIQKNDAGGKYLSIVVGIVGLMTTIVLAICFWIVPNQQYNLAMSLYDAEQYEEAIIEFEVLEDFRNSKEMVVLSKEAIKEEIYHAALALFESKQYAEAIVCFETIEDYKDSKKKMSEAEDCIKGDSYALAESHFNEQNYVEALTLYTALGDYKDCKQKIEQIYNRLEENDGIIYYGSYKGEPIAWQTVKAEDDKLLLITKNPVCELPYNDEVKNVEWNESTLCKWLNTEFIKSFSHEQAEAILSTEVDGADNKVFILSQKEVKKVKNTILKCDQEWWLRTKVESNAMFVNANGKVDKTGENVVRAKGIRACIWLSLE